jgi:hypothetical protein
MFEALPALALLTADGMRQVAAGQAGRLGALLPGRRLVPSLLVSGTLVAVTMFLPPRLKDLSLAGSAHHLAGDLIAERGVRHALVFYEQFVPLQAGMTWAYGPPDNSPLMDDDILFVKFWPQRPEENRRFWQQRHADRPAFYFGYDQGRPELVALTDHIARLRHPPPRSPPP